MQTILIATQSESFRSAFAEIAKGRFKIVACKDGHQVLKQFISEQTDALVLDMELPGIDGFSILRMFRNNGYSHPVVALTACIQSTYLAQMVEQYQIDCVIAKPCTAAAVLKNICEILECGHPEKQQNIECRIDNMLLELNFNARLKGYRILAEAVKQYETDPTQQITKSLYPSVAKACGGSSGGVEHAMRTCISCAWSHRNESVWNVYFPPGKGSERPPSNSKFIARMVKCLRNKRTG
ncbi:MAG: response regulator [Oscillospiraceae bacterium]|nr:response regulator [Oscillospiraceae bacterium]